MLPWLTILNSFIVQTVNLFESRRTIYYLDLNYMAVEQKKQLTEEKIPSMLYIYSFKVLKTGWMLVRKWHDINTKRWWIRIFVRFVGKRRQTGFNVSYYHFFVCGYNTFSLFQGWCNKCLWTMLFFIFPTTFKNRYNQTSQKKPKRFNYVI